MERKKYAQVCGVCGKQETTGLTAHGKRKHNGIRQELFIGYQPSAPWCENWFDLLDKELKIKYKDSQPSKESPNNIHEQDPVVNESLFTQGKVSYNSPDGKSDAFSVPRSRLDIQEEVIKQLQQQVQELKSQSTQARTNSEERSQYNLSDMSGGSANDFAMKNNLLPNRINEEKQISDQAHEQCNKLIEELKSDKNKLEKKIEDCVKEKDEMKRELTEVIIRVEEKDKQLIEWRVVADKLMKSKATFEKWKQEMEVLSARSSIDSQHQTPVQSCDANSYIDINEHMYLQTENVQDDSASPQVLTDNEEEEQMQINASEERKETDITVICPYCKQYVVGPPHIMRINNGTIEMSGAFYNHWSTICSYFDEYHKRLKIVATEALKSRKDLLQSELQLALQQDTDKVIQCFKLSTAFQQSTTELTTFLNEWKTTRKESYPFLQSTIDNSTDVVVNYELEFLQKFCRLNQQYCPYKSEGYMRWVNGEFVSVTQQIMENALVTEKMKEFRYRCATCKKIFSCEAGWRNHTEWMMVCGRTCTCDVFSFAKYSHSLKGVSVQHFQREIKEKELNKLEALLATTIEKPELTQPELHKTELETKRDIQRDDSLKFIKTCKNQLAAVENWLLLLSKQCKKTELKVLDDPICDAIVYPRCPLIFGDNVKEHDRKLKVFLIDHGIPVRLVTNVATNNKAAAFVYLVDSDNKFSSELVTKLIESLGDLSNQIKAKVPLSELQKQRIEVELNNLYIRQMDYTKDFLGFLMVLSLLDNRPEHRFDILRELGRAIGMDFSANHSQLVTSIQFEAFITDLISGKPVRSERLKIYNKLVQLLTITSIKAKLSMGTSKLFKAPLAFHQNKILPSFNDGLTRIELSSYFNSVQEWKEKALNVDSWERRIKSIQDALQNASEQLIYKVHFKVFWDSFWLTVDDATTIIVFESDLWTIVYAYSSRSYLFTGHCTDKHNKSGTKLTFLQRFAGKKTLVRVGKGTSTKEFLIQRHGESRQIPIESLNVIQYEEHRFPIDLNKWFYNLSKEQLDQIYFTCDNQDEFDEWFGQDPVLARSYTSKFYNQTDQPVSVTDEQMPYSDLLNEEDNFVINTSSQQMHERKIKQQKKRSRSRDKQDVERVRPKEKNENKKVNSKRRSYMGGGTNITQEVEVKHTKKGNAIYIQSQGECIFKPEAGGSRFYMKYKCDNHCGMIIEKYDSDYYLFLS